MQSGVDSAASQRPNMPLDVMTRAEFEWSRRQQRSVAGYIERQAVGVAGRARSPLDRMDRLRTDTDTQVHADRKAEKRFARRKPRW